MCFNNQQPTPPQVAQVTPPPPPKPLQIAQRSTLPARPAAPVEKKPVAFGAKSLRDPNKVQQKRDAASLLVPLNTPSEGSGGINA